MLGSQELWNVKFQVCGFQKRKRTCVVIVVGASQHLRAFSTDATGQLNVLRHNGDTLGVDGAQVGVFEKSNKVSFGGFLESKDSGALESEVGLEVLSDFTDQTLERQLADQELRALLVAADFTQSDGSRTVTVRFLDTAGGGCALASSLGGKLLARSLASGRFTCGLLGTGHFDS